MMRSTKLLLASLMAMLLMAIAVSNASANRLSLSNHNLRVAWTSLEFVEPSGFFGTIRCPLTLEGSFHSNTIRKVENALIGHVSRASVASCPSGHATILKETLPWHVTYQGFKGTLPIIRAVRLLFVNMALRIEAGLGILCLIRSTTTNPFAGEAAVEASGNIITLQPDETRLIPATGESCPATSLRFRSPSGDGQVTLLGNTTRIRITLI